MTDYFTDLQLLREYPKMLAGRYDLRLYTSRFIPDDPNKPIEEVRFHFGFPEEMLPGGFRSLVETSPYWGKSSWTKIDGFFLYYTHITSNIGDLPDKELEKYLDFMSRSYNQAIRFIKKR